MMVFDNVEQNSLIQILCISLGQTSIGCENFGQIHKNIFVKFLDKIVPK